MYLNSLTKENDFPIFLVLKEHHNFRYDIALITLNKPFKLSKKIIPICLPFNKDKFAKYQDKILTVQGTTENNSNVQDNYVCL